MKKNTITKVTSGLLVLMLAFVMLFVAAADTVGTVSAEVSEKLEEAAYIKELGNVDTNYEQFLDGSVVQRLPDGVNDNDEISVIIMLDNPSLLDTYDKSGSQSLLEYASSPEALALKEQISAEKEALVAALDEKGVTHTTGADYSAVFTGFEIILEAKDFTTLCQSLGAGATPVVSEVYNVADTQLVENKVNVYDTGIFDSSDFAYDGSGMVVAVLDTGLDYTHTAFSPDNFTSNRLGLTKDEVAAVLGETNAYKTIAGLSASDVYVNDKVPFAFDYADGDSDVYSIHNNHGTHVSGVIVGNDYDAATRPEGIIGVAPNAQLVSMKIFSDTYDSARASWILAALEDCVLLGVDVINMSLGTACGFSRESDEEILSGVYDKIRAQGISLIVAASNSFASSQGSEKNGNLGLTTNPDTATVGSPSTYDGALSVASISGTPSPYILAGDRIIYLTEATNSKGDEKDFFDEILVGKGDSAVLDYVLIPGVGRPADYMGMDVTGKIVLVRRGDTTFEEKANAAYAKGAAGIIIFNNTSGEIKMNAGITKIPICSISQDDGEFLAASKSGQLSISKSQTSGPFMSDFSSWGPSPDLGIKPEITAHGGNIYSAITGGEYDRLSGTSMACPNIAGVVTIMRQFVIDNFADQVTDENGNIDNTEVNAIINRLMMSTADILYNMNGLPYAVRRQGAGLANLTSMSETPAYILTYDREDGTVMDKTKIELGDDPTKSGVYTLSFDVFNFGTSALSYDISASVMTEGVYETPTYAGLTTVTTEGYLLDADVKVTKVSGGQLSGSTLTVGAGDTAKVTVTITLTDEDKAYLDASFKNGMYVEGFVSLTATSGTEIDLNVPYLAFYGDWNVAPLFDIDYFETNRDELDDSIQLLDKTLPDAYATRPIGGLNLDYVNYLGSYYFLQNPSDRIIAADRDYIAISNAEGTVHSLRFIWMGMLRNAEKIVVTITDDATGEVVFETTEELVRKSYGDGGSYIYPANVDVEFDATEENLKNNTTYSVKVQGYTAYGDGGLETNLNNTFEFPLTTDFEAPLLTGVEYKTVYDRTTKRNRLYATLKVYDNHYSMALQTGYLTEAPEDSEYDTILNSFSNYLTPIYSSKNSITEVEIELTDYIYDMKDKGMNPNIYVVSVYDYAMNQAVYEVPLPTEYLDIYVAEADTELKLSPNEVYSLNPLIYPETEWPELLTYTSSNPDIVRVVNNKVVAVASGKARITISDPSDPSRYTRISVTVHSEFLEDGSKNPDYKIFSKPVAADFKIWSYETLKAFYRLDSDEREIGEVGDIRVFGSTPSLSLYPSESVRVNYDLDAYFPEDTQVVFESGDESIVKVSQDGTIVAQAKGFGSVYVKVLMDGKTTTYTKTISIEVKDPYIRNGAQLTNYFGMGGQVVIPENLLFTEIGQYAFANYEYIEKTAEDEISEDDPNYTKIWYIGENTITSVVIPEGVEKIGPYAFAMLTELKEVTLPSTLKYIEYGAFYGCEKLEKVKGLENVVTINKYAFEGCNLKGKISLDSAHAIADYAFAGNSKIEEVVISETLRSIGAYAFYGNSDLEKVTINAEKIKLGDYAFGRCSSLTEININTSVIPTGAFVDCTSLKTVTIGEDVSYINPYAFSGTKLASLTVAEGNTHIKASADGRYILSADGSTLLYVVPGVSGAFSIDDTKVTAIGQGAFAGNTGITSVSIPSVKEVYSYAFADCTSLSSITLSDELTLIDDYAFFNTPITSHPSFAGVSEIGDYAFAYTDITKVTIPAGLVVGEGAFTECQSLNTVVIGDGAKIGMGAFMLATNAEHPRTGKNNYSPNLIKVTGGWAYEFLSALTSLTIGADVEIGEAAFYGAANLVKVTLGDGVSLGKQAFYNASKLADIDLSGVTYIGELAFSGDVMYAFSDSNQSSFAIVNDSYVFVYYSPALRNIDISSVSALGDRAFQFCPTLQSVVLGEKLTEIPYYAFDNCTALTTINLEHVEKIGEAAFSITGLTEVDLSSATEIEKYAFVQCEKLASVTLNPDGTAMIGEGAFSECAALTTVNNLNKVSVIDNVAFAHTRVTDIDLSSAISVGDLAFLKNSDIPVSVTLKLSDSIEFLGDNPFAMCRIAPDTFSKVVEVNNVNGIPYYETVNTYDLSDTVKVIDGSLYITVPYGLELVTYIGDAERVDIPEGVVRISAMAFAGSDVVTVSLPHTLNSIGHKGFYGCDKLSTVIFKSYEAPVLEEEFEMDYYSSYQNMAATGDYKFQWYDGSEVVYQGLGIVPFYMIDAYNNYSNTLYGATFVDYIGHGDGDLIMIRPSNGLYYDTFIFEQYFSTVIDGATSASDDTLAAIDAINKLPSPVQLTDKELVEAARAAYDKIVALEQQALVYNYSTLTKAETRIKALSNTATPDDPNGDGSGEDDPDSDTPGTNDPDANAPTEQTPDDGSDNTVIIILTVLTSVFGAAALALGAMLIYPRLKKKADVENDAADSVSDIEAPEAETETEATESDESEITERDDTDRNED